MNRICALVILYNGNELTEESAACIAAQMAHCGVVKDTNEVTIVYKDAETIADGLLAAETSDNHLGGRIISINGIKFDKPSDDQERITAAVSFIGNMFEKELIEAKKTHNYAKFAVGLISAMTLNPTLKKSMEIITTCTGVISKELQKRFNFTESTVEAIKQAYSF